MIYITHISFLKICTKNNTQAMRNSQQRNNYGKTKKKNSSIVVAALDEDMQDTNDESSKAKRNKKNSSNGHHHEEDININSHDNNDDGDDDDNDDNNNKAIDEGNLKGIEEHVDKNRKNAGGGGGDRRERVKSVNTVAARMKQVVEKLIDIQRQHESHPQITIFFYKSQQSEITNAFFVELQKENPSLFHDKHNFFALLLEKYDEFIAALGVADSGPSFCSSSDQQQNDPPSSIVDSSFFGYTNNNDNDNDNDNNNNNNKHDSDETMRLVAETCL